MKISNGTTYRTDDLRAFLIAAHNSTGTPMPAWKRCVVKWSRHNVHWGCARYDNSRMLLTIPKGALSVNELAFVVEHELAHNRGIHHADMDRRIMRYVRGEYQAPAWASMPLREKDAPEPVNHVEKRALKAQAMLDKWERKLALAKTKRSQWARKVAYYERKAALPKST